jgi:hypothetical protein
MKKIPLIGDQYTGLIRFPDTGLTSLCIVQGLWRNRSDNELYSHKWHTFKFTKCTAILKSHDVNDC